jgi:hypothetical protein
VHQFFAKTLKDQNIEVGLSEVSCGDVAAHFNFLPETRLPAVFLQGLFALVGWQECQMLGALRAPITLIA